MQETFMNINWLSVLVSLLVEVIGGGLVVWWAGKWIAERVLSRRAYKAKEQQLDYLRNLLSAKRRSVLQARDIAAHELPPEMGEKVPRGISGARLRAAFFNQMLRELGDALDYQTSELTPLEKKEVRDALDWFHRPASGKNVLGFDFDGQIVFPFVNSHRNPPYPTWVVENSVETILPRVFDPHLLSKGYQVQRSPLYPVLHEGRWPVPKMTKEQATEKFENLRRLRWLGLKWPRPRLKTQWSPLRDENAQGSPYREQVWMLHRGP